MLHLLKRPVKHSTIPLKPARHILLITCICLGLAAKAQHIADSCIRIPLVGVHFAGDLPQGDLAQRFGPNFSAGISFLYKSKKNWLFGAEGSYFFGRNVKEDVVKSMRTPDGFVIDNEGYPADLRLTERGWNIYLVVGKIFSKVGGHNPNCGLMAWAGPGYMQHKIKLYDANQKIAAIKGDLKKGYDRLSGGPALTQFVGWSYLSNRKLVNFYFGVELFEGFTKSYRIHNYDTGLDDTKKRFDMQVGFRAGWYLPIYKRVPKEFYYN